MRKQCGTQENKYNPELHQEIHLIINGLLEGLDYSHALQLSVFMPLVIITRMMEQGNTFEQGGLCLRQIAHCCRLMGQLDTQFYESPLYQQNHIALLELGRRLGWYDTTITRWVNFAQGE
ncbi:hypothetical protein [Vibrio owensii]|uniref:Uncharacterized protein n=1 Tax=Vibrio owensii CAIM 1854 = LMG 25443 TaxID=1229493 RepID=A0A0C1Z3F1_9VIBR|nr:hypothetical protein [Vibrio owensii]KIF51590.1 hypothetical protein H735_18755 [Vibrio owensii CAIM 1854 = LMG 25443]